jgi:L-ascorbate metabolism protein UlaG (beta-lactamase superfamily)
MTSLFAHENQATYLGNEGVMITSANSKVLFDPFFHNNFGLYSLVPDATRDAIFNGKKPYDNISAIFISHAHADHFSAQDMKRFLTNHPKAQLIAPAQAVKALQLLPDTKALMKQTITVSLKIGDKPWSYQSNNLKVDAVRIPHAGWPSRADIENIVFRVTLDNNVTVMHMGDADPNDGHFKPYKAHWMAQVTNTAFPPYWFFGSKAGNEILNTRINAKHHIGVHVPATVPQGLKSSGLDYFSLPGEQRKIN